MYHVCGTSFERALVSRCSKFFRAIVEVNAKSPHEQRVLIHDLSFLNEDEQQAIKDLERQLVDRPIPKMNLYLIGVRCPRAYLFGNVGLGPARKASTAGGRRRTYATE
jgi:hypothetical protein